MTAMCLVAMIPALSLSYLLADRGAQQRAERSAGRMERMASILGRSVEGFIEEHRRAISLMARNVAHQAEFGDDDRLRQMMAFHQQYRNFKSTISTDAQANLRSSTFREKGIPVEWVVPDQNVGDRKYFQAPKHSGSSFVSDVFAGRGTGEDVLIVAISAPIILSDGRFVGIVEGSLELDQFERLFAAEELPKGLEVVLVDHRNRMIQQSDGLTFGPLSLLDDDSWSTMDGDGTARAYITSTSPAGNGWRVLLRLPVELMARQRWSEFRFALALGAIALLITIGVAVLLAAAISHPLAWLDEKVCALDPEHDVPDPPRIAPPEIRRIANHLRQVTKRLRRSYSALHQAVNRGERLQQELADTVRQREAEIAERTAELVAVNARLESLSRQDGLTGALNRRAMDEALMKNTRAAAREGTPLSVLLVDVDYFKQYNDRYGHLAGDDCLRRIAQAVTDSCSRPRDVVARYGGEEFAVILPQTPAEGAAQVAERLRATIAELELRHADAPYGIVTVSVGFATAAACTADHGPALLHAADQALYRAKNAGRNRTAGTSTQHVDVPGEQQGLVG